MRERERERETRARAWAEAVGLGRVGRKGGWSLVRKRAGEQDEIFDVAGKGV